jgi:gliding motility-associated-like protein
LNNGAVSAAVSGGTGSYTYLWGGGQTATTVYSIVAGSYSVTVTDSNGCTVSDQIVVTEPPQLAATISPDTLVCPGTQLPLSVSASGGTGTYAYSWTPGGQTTSTVTPTIQADQVFSVTVTDNNGCSEQLAVSVTVETMDPYDLSVNAAPPTICLGDSSVLTAVYAGSDPSVTLTWQHCAACPAQITVGPAATTGYTVVAENYCGQTISASVQVIVNLPPQITLDPDPDALCPGEEMSFYSGTSNPQWQYSWDFGDGGTSSQAMPEHAYTASGQFPVSVTVTDANGCTSTAANGMVVTVNPQAVAQFSASSEIESILDPEFAFYNESQDASTYQWSFGDGATSTQFNVQHTYAEFGNYTVTLYANNSYNCPDSTEMPITVEPSFEIYIPNAFTPDNDQYNQTFAVDGYGLLEEGFTFEIYNRWGEMIFRTTDIHQGWDGTYRSSEAVQDGVYTWIVYFKDLTHASHRREGHVSLLK